MPLSSRRQFLSSLLATAVSGFLPTSVHANPNQIQLLEGDVYLNEKKIDLTARINTGDTIRVASNGKLIFKMGEDAYLIRSNSEVQVNMDESNVLVSSLRLVTGAILGVFGKRSITTKIETPVAVIGIRGTAVYAEYNANKLYTCTCYGHTHLKAGKHVRNVKSTHHNAHLVEQDKKISTIRYAKMHGHGDEELRMLEAIVGRKPKFDLT